MTRDVAARLVCAAVVATVVGGCDSPAHVRVGAKSFAEQQILAEMVVALLDNRGYSVEPVVQCGDTYGCQSGLRGGSVDLMVDYTGTGIRFVGGAADSKPTLETLRKHYEPLGIRWVGLLGFDNSYSLLMRSDRAASLSVASISDLDKVEGGIRVACPAEFMRRPGDGMGALVRRYGLRLAGPPLLIDDQAQRYGALLDGRVDVVVGYGTDGARRGLDLSDLGDPLGFFPRYDAALVARAEALSAHPALEKDLAALQSSLDVETMRDLNYEVEVGGRDPADVAAGHLASRKLIEEVPSSGKARVPVPICHADADELGAQAELAARAARVAFPGRSVKVTTHRRPVQALTGGAARLAVVGAERFFNRRLTRVVREERFEAVAVVDTRMVHALVRPGAACDSSLAQRVGLMPKGSGGFLVGSDILAYAGLSPADNDTVEGLLAKLAAGDLETVLVVAVPGDSRIVKALSGGSAALCPIRLEAGPGKWRPSYLRAARIGAKTYSGQDAAVETLASQVLLASSSAAHGTGKVGGPASALLSVSQPLTNAEVRALADAVGGDEAPDPMLPSAWVPRTGRTESAGAGSQLLDTVLNLLVFLFVGWLALQATARSRA